MTDIYSFKWITDVYFMDAKTENLVNLVCFSSAIKKFKFKFEIPI